MLDIGGRSTELILGQGLEPKAMESYRVGSIAWSTRYFPQGHFTPRAFQMAEVAAKAVLDEALSIYRRDVWDIAYGSAGTVGAVGDVLVAAGWPAGTVSRAGLDWLLEKLLSAKSADQLRMAGMKDDRRAIIGGGRAAAAAGAFRSGAKAPVGPPLDRRARRRVRLCRRLPAAGGHDGACQADLHLAKQGVG